MSFRRNGYSRLWLPGDTLQNIGHSSCKDCVEDVIHVSGNNETLGNNHDAMTDGANGTPSGVGIRTISSEASKPTHPLLGNMIPEFLWYIA